MREICFPTLHLSLQSLNSAMSSKLSWVWVVEYLNTMLFSGFNVRINLKGGDSWEAMADSMAGVNDRGGEQHARKPELE